jgi:hypothetical protein
MLASSGRDDPNIGNHLYTLPSAVPRPGRGLITYYAYSLELSTCTRMQAA